MSAVSASPSSPERCSRLCAISCGGSPSCSSIHSSSPGSTDPQRVAMTRPSSGVNPMVVSTLRPSRTAASEAPAQMAGHDAAGGRNQLPGAAAAQACDSPWKP